VHARVGEDLAACKGEGAEVEQFELIASTHWAQTLAALIIAFIVWRLCDAGITRFFARRFMSHFIPRVATYASLSKSLVSLVIGFALVLVVLHIWSVDVLPALWSAGVVGVVLGFGAQAIVRDLLAGVFFLFEDTYDVGDGVELTTTNGTVSGTVDAIGLREVRIVDSRGAIVSVPNGNIVVAANTTRLPSRVRFTLSLPLRSGVIDLRERLTRIASRAAQSSEAQVDHIAVHLEEVSADNVTFAVSFHVSRQHATGASAFVRETIATNLQSEGILPGLQENAPPATGGQPA
jgi:small-conductance mechanosensitive channel